MRSAECAGGVSLREWGGVEGGDNNASDQPDPVQETGHHHQL